MPTVIIQDNTTNEKGIIKYDENQKKFPVDWELTEGSGHMQKLLEKYFNTERFYRIPESDKIDDFRIDRARPIDSSTYFELSLCEMQRRIGISLIRFY